MTEPYINIFGGKLKIALKEIKPLEEIKQEIKPEEVKPLEVPKEDKIKAMLFTKSIPVVAEVTPQTPIYKFGINTREDLAKLMNGVILSYEGYSEIELKEMGLDVEKISKLKEILLKK
jgi:hypothetical protein